MKKNKKMREENINGLKFNILTDVDYDTVNLMATSIIDLVVDEAGVIDFNKLPAIIPCVIFISITDILPVGDKREQFNVDDVEDLLNKAYEINTKYNIINSLMSMADDDDVVGRSIIDVTEMVWRNIDQIRRHSPYIGLPEVLQKLNVFIGQLTVLGDIAMIDETAKEVNKANTNKKKKKKLTKVDNVDDVVK